MTAYYHGGIGGLRPGAMLVPSPPHVTDGCPICVARAAGRVCTVAEYRLWLEAFGERAVPVLRSLSDAKPSDPIDPPSGRQALYITTDLRYARWYAARSEGDLYRVEPVGEIDHGYSIPISSASPRCPVS